MRSMRRSTPARASAWLALVLLLPAACASPPRSRDAPNQPTLWRARAPAGAGVLYLLGSVHVGRPSMLRLPEIVEQAFARADELVLEIDPVELDSDETRVLSRRYAFLQPPETLRDRVSARTFGLLVRALEERGEEVGRYLHFAPWFLATHLEGLEVQRLGLDPELGLDRYFAQRAARKPVVALESAEYQLRLLASLPDEVQELMLLDSLERTADLRRETEGLIRAWSRGDDAELERIAFRPLRESPELRVFYEHVMFGRNQAMAQRLASLSRDHKRRFVVVGAAHLVGRRGIPALLEDYGFRLERLGRR